MGSGFAFGLVLVRGAQRVARGFGGSGNPERREAKRSAMRLRALTTLECGLSFSLLWLFFSLGRGTFHSEPSSPVRVESFLEGSSARETREGGGARERGNARR